MKKIYLLFLALLLSLNSFAQLTYQIGSGTGTTSYFPLYYNYDFNYSQVIYTVAELNAQGATIGGQITKIKYKPTSGVSTSNWRDWVVYMGNTTKTNFSSDTDWVAVSSITQVFNGQIVATTTANGWFEITLSTPFTWDGTSNIVVAIDENTPTYGTYTDWAGYTLAPASGNKGIYYYRDTTNIDPATPPSGTRSNNVAQIQFVGSLTPACTGTPTGGTVSVTNQIVCANGTPAAISVTSPIFAGLAYQWEESDDNGVADAWANAVGGTGATTLSYAPPSFAGTTNKYYRLKTTCTASAQSAYSTVHTVLIAASPNAATALAFTNIGSTSMTIGWTNTNGNRRLVVVSPVNTFVARTNGTGPAHTAATTFTGTGEQIVYDGTGSSVTVTGLTCNTTYYVQVYEYFRCGSAAPYSYWYATPLTGNQKPTFFQTAVALPASTNFVGFTGDNLSTVFPGWREVVGDGPLTGTTSGWTNSTALTVVTAKVNLFYNTKKDWIVSPTVSVNAFSRVRFKAAITDYNNGNVDPAGMQGTDDKVEVMISTDPCGVIWTPLYTFNAANTVNLTNVLTDYTVTIPSSYVGQNVRVGFKATEGIDDTPDYDFHITDVFVENTPPPTVTTTKTDNVCFGGITGTATAIPAQGTPPYTYSWAPSGGTGFKATALAAGTYTVTVTDANNLTATANVTVGQPNIIAGTIVATNVSCNGANNGSATVTASGGTTPYTYLWNTGATGATLSGVVAGTYSVVITDITDVQVQRV